MVPLPDGTLKEVNKRGFLTKRDGLAWLADAQAAGRKGEYVETSRQRLGAYCAEVIDGMRVGPQTRAFYVKNRRNHIEPYPIAQVPLAQLTGQRLTAHYRALEKQARACHRAGVAVPALASCTAERANLTRNWHNGPVPRGCCPGLPPARGVSVLAT
jgi:hypothetical protein